MDEQITQDLVTAGWSALQTGDWVGARAFFERSLAEGETAEALEGLGWAAYYLDNDRLTFDARERAFLSFRRSGDDAAAARVAAWLAADWLEFRGEPAVANGWLRRAHRLLDTAEPGPGHGWLALHEAAIIIGEDDVTARRLAIQAVELARTFGVPDLEMVGLGLEGAALVSGGDLAEGMRRLDEAAAVALSGEAEIVSCVAWTCCCLIAACEQVRDYDRAGEWCGRLRGFSERYGIALPLSQCRAKYASVLIWQGRWDEADAELRLAADGFATARPPLIADALVRLGELRLRQGRLDEADEAFDRCEGHPRTLLGRAALAVTRGRPGDAADLTARYLRRYPVRNRIERCAGLELAVRARIQLGDEDGAREALEELRQAAGRAGTRPLRAAVHRADAAVAAGCDDHDGARRFLEDALDLLATSGAPYETAQVRLDLAASLSALGRDDAACRETEAALAAFHHLGALGEVTRADEQLERIRETRSPGSDATRVGPLATLTRREREVVALVAEGLTNHEIATRLVISVHTVHRHVTSILRKLGLPTRSAAASVAVRHGLA